MTRVIAILVRRDLRRRWVSVAILTVLVGLAGGLVLAAATGARRAGTAVDRMLDASATWDATVEISAYELDAAGALLAQDRSVDVATAATYAAMGEPGERLFVLAGLADGWLDGIYQPEVLEGRLPARDSIDEISVSSAASEQHGIEIGDSFTLEDWLGLGLVADVKVVGIHRGPLDLAAPDESPNTIASSAFGEHYLRPMLTALLGSPDEQLARVFLPVRLADDAPPGALDRLASALGPDASPVVRTRDEWFANLDGRADAAVAGLWLLAAVGAAATVLLVVATTGRLVASSTYGEVAMRSIGLGPHHRTAVRAAPVVLVAAAAAVIAAVAAVVVSPLTVLGPTRDLDPDRGLWMDPSIVVIGAVALFAVISGVGLVWAGRQGSASVSGRTVLAGLPMPVTMRVGTDLALSRAGRGPLAACAVATGVALIAAVAVYIASERQLAENPELFGSAFDAIVFSDPNGSPPPYGIAFDDPRMQEVSIASTAFVDVNGIGQYAVVIEPVRGSISATVLSGRTPVSGDEVLVAPSLMKSLDLDIGDTINVAGDTEATFRIVGTGLLPNMGDIPFATGIQLAPAAVERAGIDPAQSVLLVNAAPGADLGGTTAVPSIPDAVSDLDAVSGLAGLLAALGVVLAVVVVSFVLAGIVRSRARDLATVQALGSTVSQLRRMTVAASVVLVIPATLVGLGIGVAVGSRFWERVADGIPVVGDVDVPVAALGAIALAALGAAVLLAALPAVTVRRQARLALRRE